MVFYWLLFGYFAAGALFSRKLQPGEQQRSLPLLLGAVIIALSVGLRYEVGGDWQTYKFLFSYAAYADLGRLLSIGDPGYQFINWLVQRSGLEIWAVNLTCSSIFTWGLYRFARTQPDPWLTFAVAIPYLVVVVAMGYTRQSVAIGIVMAGLAAMERGASVVRFALYVAVAALFHKTVVVVLPLVILGGPRNSVLNFLVGIAGTILLYDLFLSGSVEGFVRNYVESEYSSQGAAIRVAMNFVPAVLYFVLRRRFRLSPIDYRIWRSFSLVSLLMPLAMIFSPSSTAVDRVALYFIPLQAAVLPRIEELFANRGIGQLIVLAYSAAVLFVWMNFAVHADHWIPYQFYPIIS